MSGKSKNRDSPHRSPRADAQGAATELRIVGGQYRGSRLRYHGDPTVRPMKHRVREAIFNLVSTDSKGRHALDLFAGTGALGLEALSRGAVGATFVEKHVPSARIVQENIDSLGVSSCCDLHITSAFLWAKRDLPHLTDQLLGKSWIAFCSPPYAFYQQRQDAMLDLIARVIGAMPSGSAMVVEADERFDFQLLTTGREATPWDVRIYAPAHVGVWRKTEQD